MICFHKWGKFTDPIDTATDYTKVQSRICEKCGKWQIKRVQAPWNIWFHVTALIQKGESK